MTNSPLTPKTENLNVLEIIPLITPRALKQELEASPAILSHVLDARQTVRDILAGKDQRLLVVIGPCSIHDPAAALDYAARLAALRRELEKELFILMRVYFEKPRTTIGWKGLIYDPHMDGSADIACGLRVARRMLLKINELGLPTATEMLDPIVPQYTADLVQVAVDAMEAARHPHSFLGIDEEGHIAIVRTSGNECGHLILRGAKSGPNYDAAGIEDACRRMTAGGLPPSLMVDCSHGNAGKKFTAQEKVWNSVLAQRTGGNRAIIGMLVESNLSEGSQPIPKDIGNLQYGVSVTDECIGWDTTEEMLRAAALALRTR